ncbi:MAG: hypothetical protein LBP54_04950, partial [Campylobacteraceae bacterium]|nr:hypothetical protein [Campylobacteraceae bacterium]
FNKNPAAFKLCKLKQVKAVEGFIKTQAKNGCIFVIVSEAKQSRNTSLPSLRGTQRQSNPDI